MRLTRFFGAALGTGLLFLAVANSASAYDGWRDRERDRHWRHGHYKHDHDHWRRDHWHRDRTVVVRERPVIVERTRPVFVQPAPMYVAPMMAPQGPSGLNLNFNIPLN
jgi:hypothetical protein